MALFLYSLIGFTLIVGSILYWTRARWTELLVHGFQSLRSVFSFSPYSRLPTTFEGDVEAGLSSSTFDLSGNVEGGDSRAGLDDASKAAILAIMKKRRLPFDEARKVYMEQLFRANGIGADGRPQDPKFVSFS
ncbi:protein precursor [Grosmannia clavigera kw1407]|uniref:Protein n=1 Tax=Grosmannia clavigera (strain kw1407 / UAMH 11150) TaxID=655863 RepID=F0XPN1_GROCL|nr:protein precursor [Grosmannia clavigera kw1407]EFX00567.1 protein precursor [Grosmannia clavigera kw1407]